VGQEATPRDPFPVTVHDGEPLVAAGCWSGITHCHDEHILPWTGAWTGRREFPALLVLSVRSRGVISAARAPAGAERTYGKEKVYGSIP